MWNSIKKIWVMDDISSMGARLAMKAVVAGLRINGKEVREFLLDIKDPQTVKKIIDDINEFKPDAIFLANHPSSVFLDQLKLKELPCHFFTLVFDDPFLMGNSLFSKDEIVLISNPYFREIVIQRGAQKIIFWPVAAPDSVCGNSQDEYSSNVSYVGSIYIHREARQKIPLSVQSYLYKIVDLKVKNPDLEFEFLLNKYPMADGSRVKYYQQMHYYLYTEANRLYRLRFLEALAAEGLKFYGNRLWASEIRGNPLEQCFKGRLDPFTQYPDQIVSTKININLRSLQGFVAPSFRDFLVMRLGGFQLSTRRYRTDVDWNEYDPLNLYKMDQFPFPPEYDQPSDMQQGVRYYLEHDAERRDMADHASQLVADNHTFSKRIEQLGRYVDSY